MCCSGCSCLQQLVICSFVYECDAWLCLQVVPASIAAATTAAGTPAAQREQQWQGAVPAAAQPPAVAQRPNSLVAHTTFLRLRSGELRHSVVYQVSVHRAVRSNTCPLCTRDAHAEHADLKHALVSAVDDALGAPPQLMRRSGAMLWRCCPASLSTRLQTTRNECWLAWSTWSAIASRCRLGNTRAEARRYATCAW
jgi:hypothetical protein